MHTIQLQLDDHLYDEVTQNGIDIKEKFKEFLVDFLNDTYPAISASEAKQRVTRAVENYHTKGKENFKVLDDAFWEEKEKRLRQRHGEA